MKRYLIISCLIFLSMLNLYSIEGNLELLLPITFRENTLYSPDSPYFVERLKGSRNYGLGAIVTIQKPSFSLKFKVHYELRQEKAPEKREGKLKNSVLEFGVNLDKTILKSVIVRVKIGILKEKLCPFFYVPRSIAFNSYIPINSKYSEFLTSIGTGIVLGNYKKNYLALGASANSFWRENHLESDFISGPYTRFPQNLTLLGPFVSLRIKKIFHLPFSIFVDLEHHRAVNKKEEITHLSGGLNFKAISSVEIVLRFFKKSNQARKSKGIKGGVKIYF